MRLGMLRHGGVATRSIAVLILVLLPVGACSRDDPSQAAASKFLREPTELRSALEAWSEDGGAIDISEYRAMQQPIDPEQNAARLYRRAFAVLQEFTLKQGELILQGTDDDFMRSMLADHAATMADIRRAARRPACDWEIEYPSGLVTVLSYASPGRLAAELLRAEARFSALDGDRMAAVESLEDGLLLARHLSRDRSWWCAMVDAMITIELLQDVESLFTRDAMPPSQIALLLEDREWREDVRQASLFEGMNGLSHIWLDAAAWQSLEDRLKEQGQWLDASQQTVRDLTLNTTRPKRGELFDWRMEQQIVAFLNVVQQRAEWCGQPYHEVAENPPDPPLLIDTLAWSLAPDPERAVSFSNCAASMSALACLAFELRGYKSEHGEYPDPATYKTPIDPYDGRPIRYERMGDGFVLRSDAEVDGTNANWRWER
ncbi:MAG: hypothetical protein D8M59_06580 [Planctomycetes bacterium]|nr:hypothetical protein [Planctomycetota bacterium]